MTSVVDLGKEKKFQITQELYERLEASFMITMVKSVYARRLAHSNC